MDNEQARRRNARFEGGHGGPRGQSDWHGGMRESHRQGSPQGMPDSPSGYGPEGWEQDYGQRGFGQGGNDPIEPGYAPQGQAQSGYGPQGYNPSSLASQGPYQPGYGYGHQGFGPQQGYGSETYATQGPGYGSQGYSRGTSYLNPQGIARWQGSQELGPRGVTSPQGFSQGYGYGQARYGQQGGWTGEQQATLYGPNAPSESWSQSQGRWNPAQGREGSMVGRGPKGYRRSDERIQEEISEALARDPDLDASNIEVEVRQGVVTLKGTVDDRQAKHLAESRVESIFGVEDVTNQIRVRRNGSTEPGREDGARENERTKK